MVKGSSSSITHTRRAETITQSSKPQQEMSVVVADEDVAKRGELEPAADEGAENKDEEDPKSGAEPLAGAAPKGDGAETLAEEDEAEKTSSRSSLGTLALITGKKNLTFNNIFITF